MTRNLTASGLGSAEPPVPVVGETWPGRKVRHGTPSGWSQHQDEGTDPCTACQQAKTHYDWRWRNSGDNTKKNRLRAQAQNLAKSELVRNHQSEYDELYAKHSAVVFEGAGLPIPKMRKRRG